MFKKVLSIVAVVLFCTVVFAQSDPVLRDDHPQTYTVVKGDTLWDISARFLRQPWLWPEIWHANPQIENPHLIFPGDVISLVYLDGKARLSHDGKRSPQIRRTNLADAIKTIPLERISQFLTKSRVFNKDELKNLPYVVGVEGNQLLATMENRVYVKGLDAAIGQRYAVARPMHQYLELPGKYTSKPEKRYVETRSWEIGFGHTFTGFWTEFFTGAVRDKFVDVLGYEVQEIGTGEVIAQGDLTTLMLEKGTEDVKQGDLILPLDNHQLDINFYPHAPRKVPDNMRVLAFANDGALGGPMTVVAFSKGSKDGVEVGQMYGIHKPGELVRDNVEYAYNDTRTVFNKKKAMVTLPEEFVGNAMIFRTFDRVSYGLIMDGVEIAQVGHIARAPVEQ